MLIVKDLAVLPDPTVVLAGTVAAVLLLLRVTNAPPDGAAFTSVTVPVLVLGPPEMLVGDTFSVLIVGGVTVKVAVTDVLSKVALMVTV